VLGITFLAASGLAFCLLSRISMPALMEIVIPRLDFLWSTSFWAVFHTILWYGYFAWSWRASTLGSHGLARISSTSGPLTDCSRLYRYIRLLGHCISHWRYKSKLPNWEKPRYTAEDVTVIIPTIHNRPEELRPSLESILACKPAKLVLVTTWNKHEALSRVAATLRMPDSAAPVDIEVLHVDKANKRLQVCKALEDEHVKTAITVMADDDVEWPSTLMPWLLAPFEEDRMGGVGTCQRVKRVHDGDIMARVFNWLGAAYIERRNFEISATHNIDGGTSCMSGRTGAYRTEILKSYSFLANFKNEKWGRYILNADDDNCVTRWLVAHQWQTWIQYERECEIETTLENSTKFLYQCSRWARSNWRSNWTSLVRERYVIRYAAPALPAVGYLVLTTPDFAGSSLGAPTRCTSLLLRRWPSWSTLSCSSRAGGVRRTGSPGIGTSCWERRSHSCLALPK
jgi:cellulose synthase/poly-beta-1,6-N-acetylglucosamine synthase-like glycosyltransferase